MGRFTVFIAILILVSCVDALDISTDRVINDLVVEGHITTSPGPHTVRISRSAKYGSVFDDFSRPEVSAFVRVRDNEGNQTVLEESNFNPGVYLTPSGFRARVGRSYTLLINTFGGERYSSIPEEVQAVPELDTIILRYKELPSLNENEFDYGVEVFGQWTDPADQANYYLWNNLGFYFIETNPEDFTFVDFLEIQLQRQKTVVPSAGFEK